MPAEPGVGEIGAFGPTGYDGTLALSRRRNNLPVARMRVIGRSGRGAGDGAYPHLISTAANGRIASYGGSGRRASSRVIARGIRFARAGPSVLSRYPPSSVRRRVVAVGRARVVCATKISAS